MAGTLILTFGHATKSRPRVCANGTGGMAQQVRLNFLRQECWRAARTRLGHITNRMAPKRVSLGFDLRVDPKLQGDDEWRRSQLLVPSLTSPVSADPSFWSERMEIGRIMGGVLPDYANALYLAKRIDLLLDDYRNRRISVSGLVPVCITSLESNLIGLVGRFGSSYFDNPPEEEELLSDGWSLLGFDVVDLNGLISGLKGCGYTEPTWSQLRGLFGGTLNQFGLFGDCQIASQFAEVRGLQIREHAPFVVVGILTLAHL